MGGVTTCNHGIKSHRDVWDCEPGCILGRFYVTGRSRKSVPSASGSYCDVSTVFSDSLKADLQPKRRPPSQSAAEPRHHGRPAETANSLETLEFLFIPMLKKRKGGKKKLKRG